MVDVRRISAWRQTALRLLLVLAAALFMAGPLAVEAAVRAVDPAPEDPYEPMPETLTPFAAATPPSTAVRLAPSDGPPGTRVQVLVTGYPPLADVDISIGTFGSEADPAGNGRTDPQGRLVTSAVIPYFATPGDYWVVIVATNQGQTKHRSDLFTVTEPSVTVATVAIAPQRGLAGSPVQVIGRGLPPDAVISMALGREREDASLYQWARSDAGGRVETQLMIPSDAMPGERWQVALTSAGSADTLALSDAFRVVDKPSQRVEEYVVAAGDTLASIAVRLGTSLESLAAANPQITNRSSIYVGQRVRVPETGNFTPELLLPDLAPQPASEMYIEYDSASGVRELRLSTVHDNIGAGPLHLVGEHDPERDETRVTQYILTSQRNIVARTAGYFVFHPEHDHWHLEDFTSFELWTHTPDGTLDKMVAGSGKMTFCLVDTDLVKPVLRNAAPQTYIDCVEGVQGISVGWGDRYAPDVPGQRLNLTNLPDGDYAVRTLVNPERHILESNFDNNEAIAYITVRGTTVTERGSYLD